MKLLFDPEDFPLTPMSLGRWSKVCGWLSVIWLFGSSTVSANECKRKEEEEWEGGEGRGREDLCCCENVS